MTDPAQPAPVSRDTRLSTELSSETVAVQGETAMSEEKVSGELSSRDTRPAECRWCGMPEEVRFQYATHCTEDDGTQHASHEFMPVAEASEDTEPARCHAELPYGVCGEPEDAGIHGNESPQNFDGYNHRFEAVPYVPAPASDDEKTPGPSAPTWQGVFEAIAHGDDAHREWLREACENLWAGKPAPEPRGKNTNADLEEQLAAVTARAETMAAELHETILAKDELFDHAVAVTAERDRLREAAQTAFADIKDGWKDAAANVLRRALDPPSTGGGESNQEVK